MASPANSPASPAAPVIVGYDGRPQGRDALALAAGLARTLDAPLVVAAVYPSEDVVSSLPAEEGRARADRLAAEGVQELAGELDARPSPVAGRSPAHGLHDLAEAEGAAALVLGSSHRGALGRVLAGNVAAQLLTGSPCPVAVAPRGLAGVEDLSLDTIGVAFDGSPESWTAVQRAADLALAGHGSVRIVHVLEPLTSLPMSPLEVDRILHDRRARCELANERAVASLSRDVRAEARVVEGGPVQALEAEAADGLDLLVMGSRGYGPLRRVLLGSVSSQLVRLLPCPVLVVPRSAEFDPTAGGMAGHDETT
jgi:nucleotide-binding universal stress UspA family protein